MTAPADRSPGRSLDAPFPLEAARVVAPTLRTLADEAERERKLPSEAVEALRGEGLFHLTVPTNSAGCRPIRSRSRRSSKRPPPTALPGGA